MPRGPGTAPRPAPAAPEAAGGLAMAELDYDLPAERIAQRPLEVRDASRLLHRTPAGRLEDRLFTDLPDLLRPEDLLVVNDTRVRAARLRCRRPGGGEAELLVLGAIDAERHVCLARPARRLPPGTRLVVGEGLEAVVEGPAPGHPGARVVRLDAGGGDVAAAIERWGTPPLPPYIHGALDDPGRYQTVYADGAPASAAAPTAGLHFTPRVLGALHARGVAITRVRLEVGLATFAPVRAERAADHVMHAEHVEVPAAAAAAVAAARARAGRVVAVGTTAVRALESRAIPDRGGAPGRVSPGAGPTRLFLHPGAPPRVIDGLLTNFHQPRSSLLLLVAAVIGVDAWRRTYGHALERGYRFLSFGDCMLCWRSPGAA